MKQQSRKSYIVVVLQFTCTNIFQIKMRQSSIYILPDSEGIELSTTNCSNILNAVPGDTIGIIYIVM